MKNTEVAGTDRPAENDEAKQGPIKVIRDGDVSASIFARTHRERTFYSVSLSRSYKDNGTFRYAKSFDADNLPQVVRVAQEASAYIRDLTQEA